MEMVLLAGLVVLALIVTAAVVGSLVRAVFWILFLPFRVVGWLLFLPLLVLKVVVAIVGAILTPVVAVVAAVLAAVVAGLVRASAPGPRHRRLRLARREDESPLAPIRALLSGEPPRRALSKRRGFRQNEPSALLPGDPAMTSVPSRRKFLQSAAVAAAGVTIVPRHVLGGTGFTAPSDTLNIAGVGVGGMGRSNMLALASQNIVALCDVDWGYVDKEYAELTSSSKQAASSWPSSRPTPTHRAAGPGTGPRLSPAARLQALEQRVANLDALIGKAGKAKRYQDYRQMLAAAEGHRRRGGGDARSHARGDRAWRRCRSASTSTCRSRSAGRCTRRATLAKKAAENQGRHADGQPGPLDGRRPQGDRVRPGRLHRRREGGPRLDQPSLRLLAAGRASPRAARRPSPRSSAGTRAA